MKLSRNFLGERVQNKRPSEGEYGYFLELHNSTLDGSINCLDSCMHACMHTYIHILYLNTVKTSVTELKIKTHLHVCRVGVRSGHKAFDLNIKLFIRSGGSDIV